MRKTILIILIIAVAAGLIWHFSKTMMDPKKTAEEYNVKGYDLLVEGETEEAKRLFKRAIKLTPHDPNYYYNLGLCYHEEQNYEKAKEYFKKALEIRPNASPAHFELACCYAALDDYDGARKHFKKAVDLKPDDHEARISYVYSTLMSMKNNVAARRIAYTELDKISPEAFNSPLTLAQAACIYSIMNDQRLALRCLARAIEMDPTFRDRAKANKDFDNIRHLPEFKRLVY